MNEGRRVGGKSSSSSRRPVTAGAGAGSNKCCVPCACDSVVDSEWRMLSDLSFRLGSLSSFIPCLGSLSSFSTTFYDLVPCLHFP